MPALWLSALLADLKEPPPEERLGELRPLWIALVGAILLGALVLYFVDRWRKRSMMERSFSGEQLSHFRVLYEQGELNREEYERIRTRLGSRLRQEMDLPAKPPAEASPPPSPGEPPASPPETGIRPADG
jgi:hypothetical protein